jgi:ectoine hydroxylase
VTEHRHARGTALREIYDATGFAVLTALFTDDEVALLRETVDRLTESDRPELVREKDNRTIRAIHGCHRYDDVCSRLVRMPRLLDIARAVLGEDVYVYQFKVNLKQPREGAAWPWHQDFAFWHEEDGMPEPRAVNIAVFLDDVHDESGPLSLIPGSHTAGLYDLPDGDADGVGDWTRHVSADLAYTVSDDTAAALSARLGREWATGPAGDALVFHPSIVHSSSSNRSHDRRAVLLVTYNAVSNAPPAPVRPVFLVDRDCAPLTAGADELAVSGQPR